MARVILGPVRMESCVLAVMNGPVSATEVPAHTVCASRTCAVYPPFKMASPHVGFGYNELANPSTGAFLVVAGRSGDYRDLEHADYRIVEGAIRVS